MSNHQTSVRVELHDDLPDQDDVTAEIVTAMTSDPKFLPPKFFYDERGSELFDEITRQPEYYLTRTELGLLRRHQQDIAELMGQDTWLIEYGSGTSEKIRLLLEALRPRTYMPVDISRDFLFDAAATLGNDYPWLPIRATCVDYSVDHELPVDSGELNRRAFFPGSSLGNFEPDQAVEFLRRVRSAVLDSGALLIGIDLEKPNEVLHRAYNDAAGITAEFNLNILHHLNRQVGTDFRTEDFAHEAFYNRTAGRVEMHLISQTEQTICIGDQEVSLRRGERIHTENSYKYSVDDFEQLAKDAGFEPHSRFTDDQTWFGLFYLEAA